MGRGKVRALLLHEALRTCPCGHSRTVSLKPTSDTDLQNQAQSQWDAGTVKGMTSDMLKDCNVHLILGNTYHLGIQPGADIVDAMGGLHEFISWDRAMLTDSGAADAGVSCDACGSHMVCTGCADTSFCSITDNYRYSLLLRGDSAPCPCFS